MTADAVAVAAMLGSGLLFVTAAAAALGWAVRTRQFDHPGRAAESIFDADEPVGRVTDAPLRRPPGRAARHRPADAGRSPW